MRKTTRMGGGPRGKRVTTDKKLHTVNINCLIDKELDPDVSGLSNSVHTCILKNGFMGSPIRTLLDTGASFSVMHEGYLQKLAREGLPYKILPTIRKVLISASKHELQVLGDVVLHVQIESEKGIIKLKNIRFTIIKQLNCPIILGIEILRKLDLRIGKESVTILKQRVPLCDTDVRLQMEVIDSTVIEDRDMTVVTLKRIGSSPSKVSHGNFLLSTVLPDYTDSGSEDSDNITSDPRFVNLAELQGEIDIHFNRQLYEVPKVIDVQLSEPLDNMTMNTSGVIHSLQDRKEEFITPEELDKMVGQSSFATNGQKKLKGLLTAYNYAFSASDFDVGSYEKEKVSLKLIDTDPVYVKSRRIPYQLREHVDNAVRQMCDKNIIAETKGSPFNSPILLVKKSNGKWRFCTDFRQLNMKIQQNRFPLPLVKDLLEQLGNSKYFSTLDLKHGFYNIQLDPKSQEYTAFSVNGRQYKYLRLPMGMSISPSVFQRIMSDILSDLIGKGVIVYLDDVLCYSADVEKHLDLIKKVLDAMSTAGILLNPDKCLFGVKELNYLGYTITGEGYKPQEDKVKVIKDFPQPTTKKGCKRFIGMMSFYSDLIPNIQYVMGPLHKICGLKADFLWEEEQDQAFERAKELLVNSSYLCFPSNCPDAELILTTDASKDGYGACLAESKDGVEHPIGFTSGSFRNSQINWTIAEKEAYAFVTGLNFFYTYLYGRHFRFRTDNRSLSFLKSSEFAKKSSGAVCYKRLRWQEFITQFSFSIELRPGTSPEMQPADCLSRTFETGINEISALKEFEIKQPFWIKHSITMSEYLIAQSDDHELKNRSHGWDILQRIKKFKPIRKDELQYFEKNGALFLAVPRSLITKLLDHYHFPLHLSQKRLEEEIRKKYIFPKLRDTIKRYIASCQTCVSVKQKRNVKTGSIVTSTPYHPWICWQLDLIGPLDMTLNGNVYILTVVDCFSRYCELRPLKDRNAITVAEALLEIMYIRGPPLNIQMDGARELQSELISDFLNDLGIYSNPICPYHPESNGIVESLNKRIKQHLRIFKSEGITWDNDLPAISLALNLQRLDELKTSPFQLLHGWLLSPSSFVSDCFDEDTVFQGLKSKSEWSRTVAVQMARAISDHHNTDQLVKVKRSTVTDNSTNEKIQIGTRCLRLFKQPPGTCAKLYTNWKGVFVVRKAIDVNTYVISLEDDPRKKYIVHRKHLRPLGTYYDSPEEIDDQFSAEKEIEAENVNGETPPATRDASDGETDSKPQSESESTKLRRSNRLKEKSTDFKKYFYAIYHISD